MASTTIELQRATARLSQYDDAIAKRKEAILAEILEADAATDKPVDKRKYLFRFIDYCICKVYGVKAPAYRKGPARLFDKTNKYPGCLYLYFYWRITGDSYRDIAKEKEFNTNEAQVSRKIQEALKDSDVNTEAKDKYIQIKINEFIEHI